MNKSVLLLGIAIVTLGLVILSGPRQRSPNELDARAFHPSLAEAALGGLTLASGLFLILSANKKRNSNYDRGPLPLVMFGKHRKIN